MTTTTTRGTHTYEIHHDAEPVVAFSAAAGRVTVRRDDCEIWSCEYESAEGREVAIRGAHDQIPSEEDDALAWGIGSDRDYSADWAHGWTLYRVGIRPDGEGSAVLRSSQVLARSETEALESARRDLSARGAIDADAALCVRPERPLTNPSPPSEDQLAVYWTLGPRGWARYDLRPWYRGPRAQQWWDGVAHTERAYDGPVGMSLE